MRNLIRCMKFHAVPQPKFEGVPFLPNEHHHTVQGDKDHHILLQLTLCPRRIEPLHLEGCEGLVDDHSILIRQS